VDSWEVLFNAENSLASPLAKENRRKFQASHRSARSNSGLSNRKTPDLSNPQPLLALGLTPKESEVLLWVAQRKTNAETAAILGSTEATATVKEDAPLSARASIDHGGKAKTTEDHVNRAADRGCCVSTCSALLFVCDNTVLPRECVRLPLARTTQKIRIDHDLILRN
jgi:hypothetical protein